MLERKDTYYYRAKSENYASRAAYKLKELQRKFGIIGPGEHVLEIGSSPGGWTKYIAEVTGKSVVAVDISPMKYMDNVIFLKADIMGDQLIDRIRDTLKVLGKESFQAVLSDAMVKTSGNGSIDHSASYMIGNRVMEIANIFLSTGGSCVFKHFQGDMTQDLFRKWKDSYRFSRITNTRASRHGSREIYMIFKGKL
ncbi:RlmE family RNA methyltransferase [Oxyplasma meridianum]|uniref:Ribosomal RNA large subunit methyltransferase E n=1 Tax=Oxyplasma meridianum TaxID=3073602 RepID=A0AAX4NJ06_9ARCH